MLQIQARQKQFTKYKELLRQSLKYNHKFRTVSHTHSFLRSSQ